MDPFERHPDLRARMMYELARNARNGSHCSGGCDDNAIRRKWLAAAESADRALYGDPVPRRKWAGRRV